MKKIMKNSNFSTPVLFLVFNRPDTTQRVFSEIRKVRPSRLFIAADGPRQNKAGEVEKCQAVRDIVREIDWSCELKTLFREQNFGCKVAVSSAIDWFFENVEEGIILEDDCLPHPSFFPFCEEMLNRYRHDTRVMQICGSNFMNGWHRTDESYYFSKYGPIWGWASWRRAWIYYDANMSAWPRVKEFNINDFCDNAVEVKTRTELYDDLYAQKIDTWDYQWGFAKMINSGLSITPCLNLISNIGFREDATHTTTAGSMAHMSSFAMKFPLVHHSNVLRNKQFDKLFFEKTMGKGSRNKLLKYIVKIVRKVIK